MSQVVTAPPPTLYTFTPDGRLQLHFHSGQTQAWDSEKRFVFVIAGSQSGKTSWGPFWLWREYTRCGPGDYLVVTSNYDLFKLKLLPEIKHIFENVLGIGRYWAGERVIELKDPKSGEFLAKRSDDQMYARIILRSASAPGGLESNTAKAAWLDECGMEEFNIDVWEAVQRRLALNEGRVLGTTTPYDLGWLKTVIVDAFEQGDPDIDVISFPSVFNPAFSRREFDRLKRTMPAWRFNMMFRGKFTKPAGMIYSDFNFDWVEDGGHKCRPFPIPAHWPRHVGVDPGAFNTGKIWIAEDPRNHVFYLYREDHSGDKTTAEHARQILDLQLQFKEEVVTYAIGNRGEHQARMDYQAEGISEPSEPPFADVEAGINRVIEVIKTDRFRVFSSCIKTLSELGAYKRTLDRSGEPTTDIANKNKFHLLDAVRYIFATVLTDNGVQYGSYTYEGLYRGRDRLQKQPVQHSRGRTSSLSDFVQIRSAPRRF
jgi:hypothetical protein